MSDPLYGLIKSAAELKRAARGPYEEFIKSFRVYLERAKTDLITADKDKVFQAQGKAQVLWELATKLEDCLTLDENYRMRK